MSDNGNDDASTSDDAAEREGISDEQLPEDLQPTDDNPLILTVPAGRRASDLVVRITAPPGTVLGAPQEIVLDGRPAPRTAGRRPPNS